MVIVFIYFRQNVIVLVSVIKAVLFVFVKVIFIVILRLYFGSIIFIKFIKFTGSRCTRVACENGGRVRTIGG